MEENKNLPTFAILVAIAGALWAFYFGVVYGPKTTLWTDEGEYSILARSIMQSGRFEYFPDPQKVLDRSIRPFSLPYSIANVGYVFGDVLFSGHLAIALFSALGVLAVFLLARKLFGDLAAITAVVLLAFSHLFWFYTARVLTDAPQIFFAAMVLYAYFRILDDGKKEWLPVLALFGFFGGMLRYTFFAMIFGLAAGLWLYREKIPHLLAEKRTIKYAGAAAGVAALFIVPYLAYQLTNSGSATGLTQDYLSAALALPSDDRMFYINNLSWVFTNSYAVLLILAGIAYSASRKVRQGMVLSLVLVLSIGALTVFPHKEDRYLIFLYPAAFALAGLAFSKLFSHLLAVVRGHRPFGTSAIAAVFAMFFLYSASAANLGIGWGLFNSKATSYSEVESASYLIKNMTSPDEWVLANGMMEVGFYSGRKTAELSHNYSRFLEQLRTYNATVFLTSHYEASQQLNEVAQAVQAGNGLPESTAYHLVMDSDKFELVKVFERNVTGQDGKQLTQPMVFVFKKIA